MKRKTSKNQVLFKHDAVERHYVYSVFSIFRRFSLHFLPIGIRGNDKEFGKKLPQEVWSKSTSIQRSLMRIDFQN